MITIEFNYDKDSTKLDETCYDVYPKEGCLYIRRIYNNYSQVRYIFPLNMIKCVMFD